MQSPQWNYYLGFYTNGLRDIDNKLIFDDITNAYKKSGFEDLDTLLSSPESEKNGPRVKVESSMSGVNMWFGSEFIFIPLRLEQPKSLSKETIVKNLDSILKNSSIVGKLQARSLQVHISGEGSIEESDILSSSNSDLKSLTQGKKDTFAFETSGPSGEGESGEIRHKIEIKKEDADQYSYEIESVLDIAAESGQSVDQLPSLISNIDMKAQKNELWESAEQLIR
ncbi:MAG TPA: hypothetical protein PL051_03915 [Candidatus Saccharibacteria bacterium]|nr:hypothetical protein [Candidatus Saccharibacteria bacterium]